MGSVNHPTHTQRENSQIQTETPPGCHQTVYVVPVYRAGLQRRAVSDMQIKVAALASALMFPLMAGCASTAGIEASSNQARADHARDAQRRADDDAREYVNCVLRAAYSYAADRTADTASAGDIADASVAKCALGRSKTQGDFETAEFAITGNLDASTTGARRTLDGIQSTVRGQAIDLVIKVRGERTHSRQRG